jgi:hypothetical protein
MGKLLWGSDFDNGRELIEEENGYTILATSLSNDGDVGFNFYKSDIWFFQIDKLGNITNSKTYGGGDHDNPYALFKNEETGGYTIIGQTKSNNGDVSGNHSFVYNSDIWYVVIDSLGNSISKMYWQSRRSKTRRSTQIRRRSIYNICFF